MGVSNRLSAISSQLSVFSCQNQDFQGWRYFEWKLCLEKIDFYSQSGLL